MVLRGKSSTEQMVMRLEFFFLWETAKLVQQLRLKREHMLISIGVVHNEECERLFQKRKFHS